MAQLRKLRMYCCLATPATDVIKIDKERIMTLLVINCIEKNLRPGQHTYQQL